MPRTGRRSLSIAAVVIATLAAPAAAQATSYTVKPNDGPCSATDTACGSLAFAAAAAAAPRAASPVVNDIEIVADRVAQAAQRGRTVNLEQATCDRFVWVRLRAAESVEDFFVARLGMSGTMEDAWLAAPTAH